MSTQDGDSDVNAGDGPLNPQGSGGSEMDRRTVLKVLATTAALGSAGSCDPGPGETTAHEALSGFAPLPPSNPLAAGTPSDPDLLSPAVPWPGLLSDEEMRLVGALCDLIIPADNRSPSASMVGVPAYINEYLSAPYPAQRRDLIRVRGGLAWLNRRASTAFDTDFASLTVDQQRAICDPIRYGPDAPEELKAQAAFFDLFRDLTSTGFWTTDEGMRDLGYMGNVPLPSFDGPPPEVLRALDLDDSDLT